MSDDRTAGRFDWEREGRTGVPEVVFAEGKAPEQIAAILAEASRRDRALLITRLQEPACRAVEALAGASLDYDPASRTAVFGVPTASVDGDVGVVCAGLSDLPVAMEAMRSLAFFGIRATLHADVGVAGLWRVMEIADELRRRDLIIAAAGMEGALFSVVAGLVSGPVIAVPTSVGYGVAAGGRAALSSALGGCAPGVLTVNIDNGFGAAAAARKILGVRAGLVA